MAKGRRKQQYLCEHCLDWDEDYECMAPQRQEYIDALWDAIHNPRQLSPQEEQAAQIAKTFGRLTVLKVLRAVTELNMPLAEVITFLDGLKGIK